MKLGDDQRQLDYSSLLRHCGDLRLVEHGRRLHDQLSRLGRDRETFIGNLLIQMYGKCGAVHEAVCVFERIAARNVFSWNMLLGAFTENGHLDCARQLFDRAPQRDVVSWTTMLVAYAQSGYTGEAEQLFAEMTEKDLVAWNAMVAAYASNGKEGQAIHTYRLMNLDGVKCNELTIISVLDACSVSSAVADAESIHSSIRHTELVKNLKVCNALIHVYGQSKCVVEAREIFQGMTERDTISWTAMISAFSHTGDFRRALTVFKLMEQEGIKMSSVTMIEVLNACASLGAVGEGRALHHRAVGNGWFSEANVRNAVLNVYGKSGNLAEAREVFDRMDKRDLVSWNTMLASYAQNGLGYETLRLYHLMGLEGVRPDGITVICIISGCSHTGLARHGLECISSLYADYGVESTAEQLNCVVDLLGRLGFVNEARVFMPAEDELGLWVETELLMRLGAGSKERFIHALRSCTNERDLVKGKSLHSRIEASELRKDKLLQDLLLHMYSKCGSVEDARRVFQGMECPNVRSWNMMLAAYAQNGHMDLAKLTFEKMPFRDSVTNNTTLWALSTTCNLKEAKHLFDSMPELTIYSWNSLISAYAQRGDLDGARNTFNRMPQTDSVSWNAILSAYVLTGHPEAVESAFQDIPERNIVSWNTLVQALILNGQLRRAKLIFDKMPEQDTWSCNTIIMAHAENAHLLEAKAIFDSMPGKDSVAWCTILQAYVQSGSLEAAERTFGFFPKTGVVAWTMMLLRHAQDGDVVKVKEMFERMPQRDLIAWNALMTAYAHTGHFPEAKSVFDRIPKHNVASCNCIITSFSFAKDVESAKMAFESMPYHDSTTWSALITAYAQNGSLQEAQRTFDTMSDQSVMAWNAVIAAHAQFGNGRDAIFMLRKMCLEGPYPTDSSFLGALMGCAHIGLLKASWECFHVMVSDYGIMPRLEHYCCVLDVLGRVGELDKAEDLMENMPFLPDDVAWHAFVMIFKIHGRVKTAVDAAQRFVDTNPGSSGAQVLLSMILRWAASDKKEQH